MAFHLYTGCCLYKVYCDGYNHKDSKWYSGGIKEGGMGLNLDVGMR